MAAYLQDGRRAAQELTAILAGRERPLDSFRAIYDFGSGAGRILTQLCVHPEARLFASDVDDAAMTWLDRNHPTIVARRNAAAPPAPYADGAFDLVYAISVFTHLNERSQRAWLQELGRVLAPGGLLLVTVHGPGLYETYRAGLRAGPSQDWTRRVNLRGPLEQEGFIFEPERRSRWDAWRFRGVEPEYGTAFHSHAHIREQWSGDLEVVDIVPGAMNWRQDAVLLRHRPDNPGLA